MYIDSVSGRSCKYAGRDGRYPSATVCKQMYSLQNMLAIDDRDGTVYVETFRIPSACVCELIDKGSTTRIRRPQKILTGSYSHFVYHFTTILAFALV